MLSNKMKKTIFILFVIALLAKPSFAEVKKASLAGSWYSASGEALKIELQSYLDKAAPPAIDGKIIAIISPHAGYIYSGPVAAYSYKAVQNEDIKTVIIIGISHRRYYDGIAVWDEDGIETPLGVAKIDRNITKELIEKDKRIYNYPLAFSEENSVEMQIPFAQVVLKNANLVLMAIGVPSQENSRILGNALYETLKNRDGFLLVASTDMSHYLTYNAANAQDKGTVALVKEFDADKLYEKSASNESGLMCGYPAVCAAMIASKLLGADRVEILKYANSGDTAYDKNQVVGYLSAAMVKSGAKNTNADVQSSKEDENMLNEIQRKRLLQIARETIENYLKTGKIVEVSEDDPILNREMGAFVTLHKKGELRGCIGNIIGRGPLYLTVRDMAIESSTGDPRFPSVSSSELKDIDIEISVLSELKKINDPNIIEMGKHGVLVRKGIQSGVFLPQVATETGWTRDEFMSNLCTHKAGLPSDAWKKGNCEIYIFTAEVFGEK